MNSKLIAFVVVVLVVISGCAGLSNSYEAFSGKYDSVTSKVGSVRGIVSDVGSVKNRAKRVAGR